MGKGQGIGFRIILTPVTALPANPTARYPTSNHHGNDARPAVLFFESVITTEIGPA